MNKKTFLIALSIIIFSTTSSVLAQKAPPIPKRISGGVVNGKAVSLPKPVYPAAARAASISGNVAVAVVISKTGSVMSASATSGHPLLRRSSVAAARLAKFAPTVLSGQPVEVSGVIVYNYQGPPTWTSIGMEFGNAEVKGLNSPIRLLDGFESEEEQIKLLAKDANANQKDQLTALATTIKSKLSPKNIWDFEFGRARAKTFKALTNLSSSYLINDNQSAEGMAVLKSLEAFRNLSLNAPAEVESYMIERVNKIVEIADSGRFTREDKENLIHYLR